MKEYKINQLTFCLRLISAFLLVITPAFSAFAEVRNRSIISYFVDNVVFQTLYSGGYYTLGAMLVLAIFCIIFKTFRQIFLSFILACLGMALMVFVYEAFEDFEFIPPIYS